MSSTLSFVNVMSWTPDQVQAWLKGLDCMSPAYQELFSAASLNGKQLLQITSSELTRLGIHKIGHQENIMLAISLLQMLQYELSSETLLTLMLKLDSLARNLFNELKSWTNQSQELTPDLQLTLMLSIRKNSSDIIDAVKRIIRWIDGMCNEKSRKKVQLESLRHSLLDRSVKLLTYARSDTANTISIMQECESLWKLCDQLLIDSADSLSITPASLEIVTIQKKHEEDLGMSFNSSFKGVHTVENIKACSAADQCHRLYAGDEIVQVNSKTVVGWTREQFVALLKENLKIITLTLRKNPQHMSLSGGANRGGVGGALKQLKGAGFPVQMSRMDKRRSQLLKHSPLVDTEPEPIRGTLSGGSATDYDEDVGSASDGDVFQDGAASTSRSRDMWRRMSTTEMKQRRATVSGGSPTLTLRSIAIVDSETGDKQGQGIQTTRPKSYFPGVVSTGAPIERIKASQQIDSRTSIEEFGSQSSSRKPSLISKYSSEDDDLTSVTRRLKPAPTKKSEIQFRIESHPSETESEKESESHVELRKKKTLLSVEPGSQPWKTLEEDRNSGISLNERLSDHESPWVSRFSSNSELISSGLNNEAPELGSDSQPTYFLFDCQSPKESGPRFSSSPVPQESGMLLKVPPSFESFPAERNEFVPERGTILDELRPLRSTPDPNPSPKQSKLYTGGDLVPQGNGMRPKSPADVKATMKIDFPAQNVSNVTPRLQQNNRTDVTKESSECCSLREAISASKPPLPIRKDTENVTAPMSGPKTNSSSLFNSVYSHPAVSDVNKMDEKNNNELKTKVKPKPVGNLNTYQLDSHIYDKINRESPSLSSDSPNDSGSQHSRNTSSSSSYDFNIPVANNSFSSGSTRSNEATTPVSQRSNETTPVSQHSNEATSISQRLNEATPTTKELTNPRRPSDYTVCLSREEMGFEQNTVPRRTSESGYKEIQEEYNWSSPRLLGVMRIDSRKRGEMAQQEKLRSQAAVPAVGSGMADVGGAIGLSSRFSRQSRLSSSTGGWQSSVIDSLPRTSISKYDSDSLSTSSASISSLPRIKNPMKKIMGVSRKISCKDLGGGDCRGWLWKKMEGVGLRPGRWVKFWFVLHHKNLFYFRDQEDVKAQGVLHLPGFTVSPVHESRSKRFTFKAYNSAATFFFASESQEDMAKWMNKMGVASLADFDIEAAHARTTAGFQRPLIVSHHTSPHQQSASSSARAAMMMSYFSGSEDEGPASPSQTKQAISSVSPAQSASGSREDLTKMYRHIRMADLDLSGSNMKARRLNHLAGATFVIKPSKIGGVDRELYSKLLSLRRTLKDKENQLIPVDQLLSSQPITRELLADFQKEHSSILEEMFDRTEGDGSSASANSD